MTLICVGISVEVCIYGVMRPYVCVCIFVCVCVCVCVLLPCGCWWQWCVLLSSITGDQLETLLNQILENEESRPYSFSLLDYDSQEVKSVLYDLVDRLNISSETALRISFYPLAIFRVRPVTRCSASLPGHSEAVLCVSFSPDGTRLASGSGDTTVRLWDMNTKSPLHTCEGHTNWVLCLKWSPDGSMLASAGMDKTIRVWNGEDGSAVGVPLRAHAKAVTCLSWQPLHLVDIIEGGSRCKLASGSADATIRLWDVLTGVTLICLSSHTNFVTCIRWSGHTGLGSSGLIYSASRDTTVKVWDSTDGTLVRTLKGHAHWVNSLTLSTDSVLATGAFDIQQPHLQLCTMAALKEEARRRYDEAIAQSGGERMLSGSDDLTMFLWNPSTSTKSIARLTGHQKLVNHVLFSPDGRLIASASFDKSIRIWNGVTGKYMTCLRGHVGAVYMLAWSPDSRQLVSCSADSTVKLWEVLKGFKLHTDLPGHADEVYAIDWSPDGSRVATGAKDKLMKLWEH
eukprot:GHVQ01011968.1.p1 GENE.GHVQ01011968.1~~GHVQ01011968.1.p1  ORF type:complete len:512 (-),score=59.55 GHVQ01011968.1:1770-3305(-)